MARAGILLLLAVVFTAFAGEAGSQAFHEASQQNLELTGKAPTDDVAHVRRILDAVSLPANIELRVTDWPGTTATAQLRNQKRYIVYSRSFMDRLQGPNKDWAALGLFAHELGHHLAGHTLSPTDRNPKIELEADEWAGWILGFLGSSQEDATKAVDGYALTIATPTHPSAQARRDAVRAGWSNANKRIRATNTAVHCRELLEMMGVHPDHYADFAERCRNPNVFLSWAQSPRPDVLAKYLQMGMKADVHDEEGNTALHRVMGRWACKGKDENIKLLLGHNANPLAVNKRGLSPIGVQPHGMCDGDGFMDSQLHLQLARFMLQSAKSRGEIDLSKPTYFETAKRGSVQDFYYFELNGADGKTQDDEGNTALHHATMGCNMALMRFMFEPRDQYGYVYMYPGAQTLRNHQNKTALDLARERRTQCSAAYDLLARRYWK